MNPPIDAEQVARLVLGMVEDPNVACFIAKPEIRSLAQSFITLLERNRELEADYEYLASSVHSLLSSYDDVIECRGDEDCDHCVLMDALSTTSQGSAGESE